MNRQFYPVIVILVLQFCFVSLNAQGLNAAEERHCSVGGRYCVTLPAGVILSGAEARFDLGAGEGPDDEFNEGFGARFTRNWNAEGLLVQSEHVEFSEAGKISLPERSRRLREVIERTKRLILKELPTEEITVRESTVRKNSVTDLSVELPNGGLVYRLTATDSAVVVLKTIFSHAMKSTGVRFLDSFETPELRSIVDEKLRIATPEPLPSCDAKLSMTSDLVLRHIAGKAKSITVEREETADGKTDRDLQMVQEYDRHGRLVKETLYEETLRPDSVEVYGCIDGKRVSKIGYVSYEDRLIGLAPERPGAKAPDDRFTTLYEVQLDDNGRIKERLIYGNDSLVHTSAKYTYGQVSLEIVSINYEGEERTRESYTFDTQGRVDTLVERMFGSGDDKIEWRDTYKSVAFDTEGNWTKRSGVYEIYENGKLDYRSTFTEYRTISYYK